MSATPHLSLTITQADVNVARAGFGKPMSISYSASWPERARTYDDHAGVLEDFALGTPEEIFAAAVFAQEPCPEQIVIGRGANKPTMRYSLQAIAANSTDYGIAVSGPGITDTDVEVTSDAAATRAEIHSALVTALNAVTGKNYTAAFTALVNADDTFTAAADDICTAVAHGLLTGDGPFQLTTTVTLPAGLSLATNYWVIRLDDDTFSLATSLALALAGTAVDITDAGTGTHTISDTVDTKRPDEPILVTGDAAGNWFSLAPAETEGAPTVNRLLVELTHADPGIAADIAAINTENGDWYALYTMYNSQAMVEAAAEAIELLDRVYIFDTPESATITTSGGAGGTADTLDSLATEEYTRTSGHYHPDPSQAYAAALMGLVLPNDPGSETWKWKQPVGVTPVKLSSTHRTNLRARNGNTFERLFGQNFSWDGKTADGDFIDVRRGLDWVRDDMTKALFEMFLANKKVGLNDAGLSQIESVIRASLKRAVAFNIINADFTVTVPKASAISAANKAIRKATPIKFKATLVGATHELDVFGTVSVA